MTTSWQNKSPTGNCKVTCIRKYYITHCDTFAFFKNTFTSCKWCIRHRFISKDACLFPWIQEERIETESLDELDAEERLRNLNKIIAVLYTQMIMNVWSTTILMEEMWAFKWEIELKDLRICPRRLWPEHTLYNPQLQAEQCDAVVFRLVKKDCWHASLHSWF